MNNIINKLLNPRVIITLTTSLVFAYICITGNKDMFTVFITAYMVILGYYFTSNKKEENK